jgi:hypothetical protein
MYFNKFQPIRTQNCKGQPFYSLIKMIQGLFVEDCKHYKSFELVLSEQTIF